MSEELKQVADLITANTIFCSKEVLTSDEAAKYGSSVKCVDSYHAVHIVLI